MAFDGFVTKSIVTELQKTIINGKINKIFEPNSNEIVFNIYSNSNKFNLSFNIDYSNCRINLTNNLKENPTNPPSFCMLLRKYLEENKIIDIYSLKLDRIVIIKFEGYDSIRKDISIKTLIVELMGKHSNIILLNDKNIIIDSIRHITNNNSYRYIFPGQLYTFPTQEKKDFSTLSFEEFYKIINSFSGNLTNTLQNNFIGFSKSYISYILNKLEIDENNFFKNDIEKLYNFINLILQNINNGNICCYNYNFNDKQDFVIDICDYSDNLSINNYIDEFYNAKENSESFLLYRNNLLKIILSNLKKLTNKLENMNLKLEECSNMNDYKLYGELITANLYRIPNNHLDSVQLENYYANNNLLTIKLDKKFLPSQNAKLFFKKYNKLKNALKIVTLQKEEIKLEIDYFESIIYEIENCSNTKDLEYIYWELYENNIIKTPKEKNNKNKNKQQKTKFTFNPIKISENGFDIFIGKNNKENDYLTFKFASKEDIWFHVKDFQGSHVVLRLNNKAANTNIILKCAKLAAIHSKAKNSNKVLVEYTKIKNITKPKGARPGFVIFNSYKTLTVDL